MISTMGMYLDGADWGAKNALVTARNGMAFRFESAQYRRSAKAEDRKLRKELTFGGPCFEGTLQKPTGVSESSPVAGAIENSAFSEILDAGRTREIQKIRPAATHLLSVNCLYQGIRKSARGNLNRATSLSNCLRFWSWVLAFVPGQHRIVERARHMVLSPLRKLRFSG